MFIVGDRQPTIISPFGIITQDVFLVVKHCEEGAKFDTLKMDKLTQEIGLHLKDPKTRAEIVGLIVSKSQE